MEVETEVQEERFTDLKGETKEVGERGSSRE